MKNDPVTDEERARIFKYWLWGPSPRQFSVMAALHVEDNEIGCDYVVYREDDAGRQYQSSFFVSYREMLDNPELLDLRYVQAMRDLGG